MLGILGTTALLLDGGPDDTWARPRERAVLATLLVHAGEVVPEDRLLLWVWPRDKPMPLNPGPTLTAYVARVRRVLARLPESPVLGKHDGGYRLDIDPTLVDLHRFRALVATAAAYAEHDPGRAVDAVDSALWLWRGLPLADLSSAPAQAWRDGVLRDDWLGAHRLRVRALIDADRGADAVAALDQLQQDFPDDVELTMLRLTALYTSRGYSAAIRTYLAARRRLLARGEQDAAYRLRRHHVALAADHPAPPLPEPTRVPRQLPRDVGMFVGRRAELAVLDEADDAGLVVVTGPGGVGKTALAVHWAHRVRDRFRDGDVFVHLAGGDRAAAVDAVLTALGQSPERGLGRRQRERLLRLVAAERRLLVVVDGVRDAGQVRGLAELLTSCLVIVTATVAPPDLGGVRLSVSPMDFAESAHLLLTRLRGRALSEPRLVDLCAGVPLLITVLAEDLARNRRKLLVPVGEDGADGEACLGSTYRALAEPERRLFRLLAVHPTTDVPLTAAYACDGRTPTETMRSLVVLAEANLVEQPDEHERLRVPGLLAEFAARRLRREESLERRRAAWRRVLDSYVASAWRAARDADGATWCARYRTNLVAVARRAHDEGCHDQLLRLTLPLAATFDECGLYVESRSVRTLAVDAARATAARDDEVDMLTDLGATHLTLGDDEAARQCLETALGLGPADSRRGDVVRMLGQLAATRGDMAATLAYCDEAIAVAEDGRDDEHLAWAHLLAGQAARAAEQTELALSHLNRARVVAQRAGLEPARAAVLAELSTVRNDLGDQADACTPAEHALALAEAIPDLPLAARICVALAGLHANRRQFSTAVTSGRRAVLLLRGSQNLTIRAEAATALANALFASGEPHQAAEHWRQAADLYDHEDATDRATALRTRVATHTPHHTAPRARNATQSHPQPPLPAIPQDS